ncbi:geranylgeranyl transferase type-2 subunit alpha isoform X2 [Photinus pyralis]|nr:geranylgeranyl transferase type-2 subunit alpha isoform X2 [Photinus pyralis]
MAYRLGMKQILESRKQDTYDPKSLAICAQLLMVNPDIYTLWNYRKEVVLLELKADNDESEQLANFLENELKLTEQCLLANPKSYGSWHHRYWVLARHPNSNWQNEFDLCSKYLTMDERNFHCWDYRRLVLNKIGITLGDELKFSTNRININFSNYSSWHYRSTLQALTADCVQDELSLVKSALFTDPMDSSAWFYLRWLLSNSVVTHDHMRDLLDNLNQLLELEPECKWILVAKCWLLKNLQMDEGSYKTEQIASYSKLQEIDSMREGQYVDYLKLLQLD